MKTPLVILALLLPVAADAQVVFGSTIISGTTSISCSTSGSSGDTCYASDLVVRTKADKVILLRALYNCKALVSHRSVTRCRQRRMLQAVILGKKHCEDG